MKFRPLVFVGIVVLLLMPTMVTAIGFVERASGAKVSWGTLYATVGLFVAVIDLPVLVMLVWAAKRAETLYARLMNETLAVSLHTMTRMFIEHWESERRAGNLPGIRLDPQVSEGMQRTAEAAAIALRTAAGLEAAAILATAKEAAEVLRKEMRDSRGSDSTADPAADEG